MDRYQARETVLIDSELSRPARLLYMLLDNYQRENLSCWPRQKTLAEKLNCSQRSLRRHLRELVAAGLCFAERGIRGGPNRYRLFHISTKEAVFHSTLRTQVSSPEDRAVPTLRTQVSSHKSIQALKPQGQTPLSSETQTQKPVDEDLLAIAREIGDAWEKNALKLAPPKCQACNDTGMRAQRYPSGATPCDCAKGQKLTSRDDPYRTWKSA